MAEETKELPSNKFTRSQLLTYEKEIKEITQWVKDEKLPVKTAECEFLKRHLGVRYVVEKDKNNYVNVTITDAQNYKKFSAIWSQYFSKVVYPRELAAKEELKHLASMEESLVSEGA